MNRVLEHHAQESDIDSDKEMKVVQTELSDNYQSDNDDNCKLVNLIVYVNRLHERN